MPESKQTARPFVKVLKLRSVVHGETSPEPAIGLKTGSLLTSSGIASVEFHQRPTQVTSTQPPAPARQPRWPQKACSPGGRRVRSQRGYRQTQTSFWPARQTTKRLCLLPPASGAVERCRPAPDGAARPAQPTRRQQRSRNVRTPFCLLPVTLSHYYCYGAHGLPRRSLARPRGGSG